ncbi:MAG: 3-ketoacyl-ACP reductase [Roseovarius sp.]|nr:3-ketoacyl-ACP reductase [Roseovarius sp.]
MSGRAALITGSTRGIGFGVAVELAKNGFAVAINGPVEDAEFKSAVIEMGKFGVKVCKACFDVSDISLHESHLEKIERNIGPLTTLVNNAGVGVARRGDPLEVCESSYDRCMNVNAKAMFFLCQAFSKRLLDRKRNPDLFYSIVNVTSSNANAVAVPRAEYCASKAAAAMISKTFAVRLGGEDIHVYDVQPGLIETDMTAPVMEQYKKRSKDGLTLLPRIGTPRDMGEIIASLACGRLPYTTGQVISADAGMLVSRF